MATYLEKALSYVKYLGVETYVPLELHQPPKMIGVVSAWKGHQLIIRDLIRRFGLKTDACLEFGVEFGFSAVAFANYFKHVTGVDIFLGDIHTDHKGDHYEATKKSLAAYENIELVRSDYKDWIRADDRTYDLIHVDIIHTYEDTFNCGLWSAGHSQCTLFHDTESFPEVKQAVHDIAKETKKKFYNYPKHFGLGIVV